MLDLVVVGHFGGADQQRVAELRIVGIPARQRQAREHAAVEQRAMDGRRVGDADAELVEVGARMESRRPRVGERPLELARLGRAAAATSRRPCGPMTARYAVAASAQSAWFVQMLLAALSRRMSCSRARSVMT